MRTEDLPPLEIRTVHGPSTERTTLKLVVTQPHDTNLPILLLPITCPLNLTMAQLREQIALHLRVPEDKIQLQDTFSQDVPADDMTIQSANITESGNSLTIHCYTNVDASRVGRNPTTKVPSKAHQLAPPLLSTRGPHNNPSIAQPKMILQIINNGQPGNSQTFVQQRKVERPTLIIGNALASKAPKITINFKYETSAARVTLPVLCLQNDKLSAVQARLTEALKSHPNAIHIFSSGRDITKDNQKSVGDLGIKDGDTVDLQIRPVAKLTSANPPENSNSNNLYSSVINPQNQSNNNQSVINYLTNPTLNIADTGLIQQYQSTLQKQQPTSVVKIKFKYANKIYNLTPSKDLTLSSLGDTISTQIKVPADKKLWLGLPKTKNHAKWEPSSKLWEIFPDQNKIYVISVELKPKSQLQQNQKIIQTKYPSNQIITKSNPILVNNEGFNITELRDDLWKMTATLLNQQTNLKNIQALQQKNVVMIKPSQNKIVLEGYKRNAQFNTKNNPHRIYQKKAIIGPQTAIYNLQHHNALNVNPGKIYNVVFKDDYGGIRNFVVEPGKTLGQVVDKLKRDGHLDNPEKLKLYYGCDRIGDDKMETTIGKYLKNNNAEIRVDGAKIINKPINNQEYQDKISTTINKPNNNQFYNLYNNQYANRNLLIPKYVPIPPSEPKVDLRRIKHPKGKITIFYKTTDGKIEEQWNFDKDPKLTLGVLKTQIKEAGGDPDIIWFKKYRINTGFNDVPLGQIFMEPKIYILGGVAKEKAIQQPNNINNLQFGNRLFNINPNYNQQYNQNNNQNANRNLLIPKYVPAPPPEPEVNPRRIKHPKGTITIFYKTTDGKIEKQWDFDKDTKRTLGDLKKRIEEAGGNPDIIWFKRNRINMTFTDTPLGQIFIKPKIYILAGVAREKAIQQPNNINNLKLGNRLFNINPNNNQKRLNNKQSKRNLKKIFTIDL